MADDKKESGILEKIVVPVCITILTAGTAPWWTQIFLPEPPKTSTPEPSKTSTPEPSKTSTPEPSYASSNVGVNNSSQRVGGGRWNWTVYINADSSTISKIKCVEYILHPTFSNRFQRICDSPTNNFALNSNGWGEFNIEVRVFFKDGSTKNLNHWLNLS